MSAILHQGLFTLIGLVAIAELSLTAFLFAKGNQAHQFPSHKYHDLLVFFLAISAWTTFFGLMYAYWIISQALHFLASVATSIWWLAFTAILWGVGAGMFHNTRAGNICDGVPPISRCRQSLTVEALGWTGFGLCLFTIFATWFWVSADDEGSLHHREGSWYSSQARERPMQQVWREQQATV